MTDESSKGSSDSSNLFEEQEAKFLGDNQGVYIPTDDEADPIDFTLDFGGFVLSLGTNCRISLGREQHPETGEFIKDLPSAKHTIEILQLLQEKTEGNLDPEEQNLLDTILHELKMAYVEEAT